MTPTPTTDELLLHCGSVHHILNAWYAYVPWEEAGARRDTANAVGKGTTPREAMFAAIAASKVPFSSYERVKPDDSVKVAVDKVVRIADSVEQEPNADLF